MFDPKTLLDALVAGNASPRADDQPSNRQRNFLQDALGAFGGRGSAGVFGEVLGQATGGLRDMAERVNRYTGGFNEPVDTAAQKVTGSASFEDLKRQAQEVIGRNPELAQGALVGAAGLLLGTRRGRAIAANLAGLGGLALISGLAYRAFQNYQSGRPMLDLDARQNGSAERLRLDDLHPAKATNEDALLFVRAMVAATAADRHLDDTERSNVTAGMTRVGLEAEATQWLEREFAAPASVEELASLASTPEKAAQVYAAARLAIDPDTLQEREFLRQLADALKLDPAIKTQIDEGASDIKVSGAAT